MRNYQYTKSLTLLILVVLVSSCSAPKKETWLMSDQGHWKQLPKEARDALKDANKQYQQGKFAKAVKNYDKFLKDCDPNSSLYQKILEREYTIAEQLIAGRRITVLGIFRIKGRSSGEKIMERISEKTLETLLGRNAAVAIANSYETRAFSDRSFYDAAHLKWLEIFETYEKDDTISVAQPTGIVGKDALLAMARCKHMAYRGPFYDASFLSGRAFTEKGPYDNAINCYRQFANQYPEEAAKASINSKLKQINEQLAEKDLKTGLYYQKIDNILAANLYYQMIDRQWPQTKAAEQANRLLVANINAKTQK